ncbi:MAG: Maf family protein [Gammaproteobacteria bacterium]
MIILASSSPYRRALLERLGLPFTCHRPEVDETPMTGESALALVMRLAREKAAAAGNIYPAAMIIGSDQVAVHGSDLLTKPGNHAQARKQLMQLSGQQAVFQTGLCVLNSATGSVQEDAIPCMVEFRKLDVAEIERYLSQEQPYTCAGSFKSEGLGISLLARIQGNDPTALVGLPLIRLCEMLRHEGVKLP